MPGPARLFTTIAPVIMLVIAAAIVVLTGPIANQVGTAFGIGHAVVLIWDIAKWPVLVVIVSVMFSLLYKASPNVRQPAFRWVSAGLDLGFYAARSYSLVRPPRTGRCTGVVHPVPVRRQHRLRAQHALRAG